MDELHAMIRQQVSYSAMVLWLQKHERCSYLKACLQLNDELRRYRLRYTGTESPESLSSSLSPGQPD